MNSHSRAFDSNTDTLVTLHGSHTGQSGTKSRILSMFLLVSSANHQSPLLHSYVTTSWVSVIGLAR